MPGNSYPIAWEINSLVGRCKQCVWQQRLRCNSLGIHWAHFYVHRNVIQRDKVLDLLKHKAKQMQSQCQGKPRPSQCKAKAKARPSQCKCQAKAKQGKAKAKPRQSRCQAKAKP